MGLGLGLGFELGLGYLVEGLAEARRVEGGAASFGVAEEQLCRVARRAAQLG